MEHPHLKPKSTAQKPVHDQPTQQQLEEDVKAVFHKEIPLRADFQQEVNQQIKQTIQEELGHREQQNQRRREQWQQRLNSFKQRIRWPWPRWINVTVSGALILLLGGSYLAIRKGENPGDFINRLADNLLEEEAKPQTEVDFFLTKNNNSTLGLLPEGTLTISASQPLNQGSVEKHLSITPQVKGEVSWNEEGTSFTFTPDEPLPIGQTYSLTLEQGATTESGEEFGREVSWQLATIPHFAAQGVTPAERSITAPITTTIEVEFNYYELDVDLFAQHFSISPNVPGRLEARGRTMIFLPEQPLEPNQVYQARVDSAFANSRGEKLKQDVVWQFSAQEHQEERATIDFRAQSGTIVTAWPDQTEFASLSSPISQPLSAPPRQQGALYIPLEGRYFSGSVELSLYRTDLDTVLRSQTWQQDQLKQPQSPSRDGMERVQQISVSINNDQYGYSVGEAVLAPLDAGFYYLEFEALGRTRFLYLVVSDQLLSYQQARDGVYVWAQQQPDRLLENAEIVAYRLENGLQELGRYRTNSEGLAALPANLNVGALVLNNQAVAIFNHGGPNWLFQSHFFDIDPTERDRYRAAITTDRPLYQPGDELQFKVVLREMERSGLSIPQGEQVTVEIGQQRFFGDFDTIFSEEYTLNSDWGSLSDQLRLPAAIPAGDYQLWVSVGEAKQHVADQYFSVEYYRKPEYELDLSVEQPRIIRGQLQQVEASLQYFSGQPLSGQSVEVRVYADQYFPPHPERTELETRLFSDGYYGWSGELVQAFSQNLGADGRVRFIVDSNVGAKLDQHQLYTVEVEYVDASQVPNVAQARFAVFQGEWSLQAENRIYGRTTGEEVSIDVLGYNSLSRENWPSDLNVQAYVQRTWYVRNQSGTYYDEWSKTVRPRYTWQDFSEMVVDGQNWNVAQNGGTYRFTPTQSGSYTMWFAGSDQAGRRVESNRTGLWVRDPNDDNFWQQSYGFIQLQLDQEQYEVGDTARLTIRPEEFSGEALMTIARHEVYQQRVVDLTRGEVELEIPVESGFAPNVFIQLEALNREELYFNSVMLDVSPAEYELGVEVWTEDRDFSPGEKARIDIQVEDQNGNGQSSEVLVYLVDEALLALEEEHQRDVVEIFHSNSHFSPQTGNSLRYVYEYGGIGDRGGGCFLSDTLVSTPDGLRPIESLLPGDLVWSFDQLLGKMVVNEVEKPLVHPDYVQDPLLELKLSDGSLLYPTSNHPFWSPQRREWQPIGEFSIGDLVSQHTMTSDRAQQQHLTIVSMQELGRGETVYNLELVNEPRNYLVGSGVLVHNSKGSSVSVRDNFQDVAGFEAFVNTGSDGRASVEVELPDNLTRWAIRAQAVTKDTKVGQGSSSLTVSRPLAVRPSTPQFLLAGDQFTLPVDVSNFSLGERSVLLTIEGTGFSGGDGKSFGLLAGQSQLSEFPLQVEPSDVKEIELTTTASTEVDTIGDGVKQTIPVLENRVLTERRATYTLDEESRSITKAYSGGSEQDSWELQVQPSFLSTLQPPDWTFDFSTASTPETVAQLQLFISAYQHQETWRSAYSVPSEDDLARRIQDGVARLEDLSGSEQDGTQAGAFGFFRYDARSVELTSLAVAAMAQAEQLGVLQQPLDFSPSVSYLRQPSGGSDLFQLGEALTLDQTALILYALAQAGEGELALTQALVERQGELMPGSVAYLALTLQALGDREGARQLLVDLWDRAEQAGGESWFDQSPSETQPRQSLVLQTSLVLFAWTEIDSDVARLDQLARTLLRTGSQTGSYELQPFLDQRWQELALVNYAQAVGGNDQDFDFTLLLNGEELASGQVENGIAQLGQLLSIRAESLLSGKNVIELQTDSPQQVYLTVTERRFESAVPDNQGIRISRQFLDLNNSPRDRYQVGELGVVELSYQAEVPLEQLRIEDFLPAGLEVVNPNFSNLPYTEQTEVARQFWDNLYGQQIWANRRFTRDGVIMDVTDWQQQNSGGVLRYVVRATFPGQYQARPTLITSPERADIFGYSQGRVVEVTR